MYIETKGDQKHLPIIKLLPNVITLLALCSGLTAIKLALSGLFEKAVIFIVIAAILDILDGRFARMLNASSKLGANLDSLCDFINFGFVPIFLMYLWEFKDVKILGWAAVLATSICVCIRLARFNVEEEMRKQDPIKANFFSGVPSPAGGLLIIAPMVLNFDIFSSPISIPPLYLTIYTIIVALLMASTIPTISTKNIKIKHSMITPVMLSLGLFVIFMFLYGWLAMFVLCILYLLSIPLSVIKYNKMVAQSTVIKNENQD